MTPEKIQQLKDMGVSLEQALDEERQDEFINGTRAEFQGAIRCE